MSNYPGGIEKATCGCGFIDAGSATNAYTMRDINPYSSSCYMRPNVDIFGRPACNDSLQRYSAGCSSPMEIIQREHGTLRPLKFSFATLETLNDDATTFATGNPTLSCAYQATKDMPSWGNFDTAALAGMKEGMGCSDQKGIYMKPEDAMSKLEGFQMMKNPYQSRPTQPNSYKSYDNKAVRTFDTTHEMFKQRAQNSCGCGVNNGMMF